MAARKSRLYLESFIPVNQTHDDIVKKIFSPGRFACTITGNLQLVGIVSLCANLAIVVVSDYCHYHLCNRKLCIGSAIASICNATALYFIFSCGYIVGNPSLWVRVSIITNLMLSVITIVAQSIAMEACLTLTKIHKSPGPMAIVGGGCLMLSSFCLFILYRYRELDVEIHDIIKERKVSEDRSSVTSGTDERKRSGVENHHHQVVVMPHIKAHIYVKHEDDKRKCSVHSYCEKCHGIHDCLAHIPKRKVSVYGRHDDGHRGHIHGSHSRKVSHDEYYPHCSKSRRKTSIYNKHV